MKSVIALICLTAAITAESAYESAVYRAKRDIKGSTVCQTGKRMTGSPAAQKRFRNCAGSKNVKVCIDAHRKAIGETGCGQAKFINKRDQDYKEGAMEQCFTEAEKKAYACAKPFWGAATSLTLGTVTLLSAYALF